MKLTFGEEVANTITHLVSAIAVLICMPIVSIIAYTYGSIIDVVGVTIFSISIFLMFLASALYHLMPHDTPHKDVMHILDHIFIYVAIAGSYTPVALSVIGGWQAWLIISIQWLMVLFGILYKSLSRKSMPKLSLTIYLIMGWTALFFLPLLIKNAHPILLGLIVAGGILYSIGAVFYAKKGFRYHHMVWHLFVTAATVCNFIGICFFLY